MAEFKLNISDAATGKTAKRDVSAEHAEPLLGKNLGDTIAGDKLGFAGYEFEITGGSDNAGFPMRHGLSGFGRQKIFTYKGTGFSGRDRWKKTQSGLRVKTTVCGQQVYPRISQINMKITKAGAESLFEEKKEEAPAEGAAEPKAEEKPAAAKEEAPKAEEKPVAETAKEAAKSEAAPAEEKAPEPQAEEAKPEAPAAEEAPRAEDAPKEEAPAAKE